jgi:AraC-like DNA-binding protein
MAPRLRVLRHESELGAWELVRRAPSPKLHGYVVGYEGYVEQGAAPVQRQQVPVAQLPLIVNFGSPWAASDTPDGTRELHGSFFAGLFDRSTYVVADGAASCVQVNLTPLGAHLLFGLPMHEMVNRIVALDHVAPRAFGGLDSRLEDRPDWGGRFELLDDVFVARLSRVRTPAPDIAWAWTALERTHGRAPIGWICDRVGRSRRHLATRFREEIGLPPKTVARIMRFERAVSLLGRRDAALAEIAFECGYYDQSHMNRDFREFAGAPPAAFAPRIVPDGGVVA